LSNFFLKNLQKNSSFFQIFDSVKFEDFLKKQFLLTGYLEMLLANLNQSSTSDGKSDPAVCVEIITPTDPKQRGCQLSIAFHAPKDMVKVELDKRGIVVSAVDGKSLILKEEGCLEAAALPV
jgi:kynureninase